MEPKILYIAEEEIDRRIVATRLRRMDIDVLTAQTEQQAGQIVLDNPTIKLIVFGLIRTRKPEIMNTSPCDVIDKVFCLVDEKEDEIRASYQNVRECLALEAWSKRLIELVEEIKKES